MIMTKTMRALVKTKPGPGLELREVPIPEPGVGEVLIKVDVTTICGSDLHLYKWNEWAAQRIKTPLIIGHEVSGRIVACGPGVKTLREGEFVAVETHLFCGHCRPCRTGYKHVCSNLKIVGIDHPGSYAEYLTVPAQNAIPTPEDLHPALAAMQEPFGNAVDTVLSESITGRRILVTGCGPIGLMAIGICRASGADWVAAVEPNEFRRNLASVMGADLVMDPSPDTVETMIMDYTHGEGIDVFLEMSGQETALNLGLKVLAMGGRVSLLGLFRGPVSVDLTEQVIFKAARVYGITGRHLFETWYLVQSLIQQHRVDLRPILSLQVPLEEVDQAMQSMLEGKVSKIALYPDPERIPPLQ